MSIFNFILNYIKTHLLMIFIVIVVIVIISISIWVIVKYSNNTPTTTITPSMYLNEIDAQNNAKSLAPITTIANPTSVSYNFSVWIYVNSWNSNNRKNVFTCQDTTNATPYFQLYFDTNSPTLFVDIVTADLCGSTTPKTNTVIVSNNFPLQRWVYVSISVSDSNIVDCYLDGRLYSSFQMNTTTTQTMISLLSCSTIKWQINFGTKFDAYLYNFQRNTGMLEPSSVLKNYYSTAPSTNNSSLNQLLVLQNSQVGGMIASY